jgi:DNA-directed RNA polymerase specialized sigma24 family protein
VITAEDVLQDVQLAARAQLSVFKGTTEKSMDTWLTRITTGCTLDAIKRELRIKRGGGAHATNASVFERSSVPDFFGVTLSPQRTPSSLAAADEAVFHALASLKWLNARAGVIVRMRYLNQMSEKRIAECLKCRLDVVRGVIWRSRMSMATIMGGPSKFYSDA